MAAISVFLLLSACTTTTVYQQDTYEALNGKTVLLFLPPVEPPMPESLHNQLMDQARQGMQSSPHLGKVLTGSDVQALKDVTLNGYFQTYGTTLTDTGLSDPELSHHFGQRLNADLLTTLQVYHLPCPVCEEGDQLWLVGQTIRVSTGELMLRVHIKNPVASNTQTLGEESADMVKDYLERFNEAARPKWHRLRFKHLKAPSPTVQPS
ncbi:MAG: hypothetical protein OEW39_07280 [Deltaproteobacteria bacterium]|nr:hypothetical protein [Deltaproteobacteria bacterium]